LFIKYVSDKYSKGGGVIEVPKGARFEDLIKLKGKSDIGDQINKSINKLAQATDLGGVITVADFNDSDKLGKGKEMVERLSNLIAIFENPALDFSSNRAEHDDLLGDAYEYLMRHFATESGKSKGQFYTPAEVSRIMAKVIGISESKSKSETIYDATCGSGSLLLKAADETKHGITIYGQENDNSTRALAVINMWLHGNPSAEIKQGNTLASPLFLDEKTGTLKAFDYVVANPPFSYKAWSNGIDPANDLYGRFQDFGTPPDKNGDYAFLLHIIKSLKSKGKGACILPHGVLFRGNAEADIRKKLVQRGYIKGIIGLPANLFYGTGIPACIIVLDKENAESRKGIFIIDASKGFVKDGNKNRLREQDIHKIVDVFTKQLQVPKYARMVDIAEIEKNEYNLNIPRYIDNQEAEDLQDIDAHLNGGIPVRDIDALAEFWQVYPTLRNDIFKPNARANYLDLKIAKEEIKKTIFEHPEFVAYSKKLEDTFNGWKQTTAKYLKGLGKDCHPKEVIAKISEDLLSAYGNVGLLDKYDIFQHLMDYWAEVMQDDLYEISAEGFEAGNQVVRLQKAGKRGSQDIGGIEGLNGVLIPPILLADVYLAKEKQTIADLQTEIESLAARMEEIVEEHGGEEGLIAEALDDRGKLTKKTLGTRIKALNKRNPENGEEWDVLAEYQKLTELESELNEKIKVSSNDLEMKIVKKYPQLKIDEIRMIVVERKWLENVYKRIQAETNHISQTLATRIKDLGERYDTPMPALRQIITECERNISGHLSKMGFVGS